MKFAAMKTDTTPSSCRIGATLSSAVPGSLKVTGPPTGDATVNFSALGLGVFSTTTLTATLLDWCPDRSAVTP